MFPLEKILSDFTKLQRNRNKNRRSLIFLAGDFIVRFCLFSGTKSISTFSTPLTRQQVLIQKRAKLKSTSVQQAWTEKILLAFRTKISIFSGFKEHLALGRTCHY